MALNDEISQINALDPRLAVSIGNSFYMNFYLLELASGASLDHHFHVPEGITVRSLDFSLQHTSNGPIQVRIYEDCDVTTGSSELPTYNFNRNKGAAPLLKVYEDSTINTLGPLVQDSSVLGVDSVGDSAVISPTSQGRGIRELKRGSDYIQRLTNNGGGGSEIVYAFTWIED